MDSNAHGLQGDGVGNDFAEATLNRALSRFDDLVPQLSTPYRVANVHGDESLEELKHLHRS